MIAFSLCFSNDTNSLGDNQGVATSEEDTSSVTFSEDDFLDEIEELQYTPSLESDRVRSGKYNHHLRPVCVVVLYTFIPPSSWLF